MNRVPHNDTWDKIDIPWNKWRSPWGNTEGKRINDILDNQLPDKTNKSNRLDKKIIIAFIQETDVIALFHENPKDFKKINLQEISLEIDKNKKIIDIFSLSIEEIKNIINRLIKI